MCLTRLLGLVRVNDWAQERGWDCQLGLVDWD